MTEVAFKFLEQECSNPLLLMDTFMTILQHTDIACWPNLMRVSKFHYKIIKQCLENFQTNFITHNTISRINKAFLNFFKSSEITNFKDLMEKHNACISGSTVLKAILNEDFMVHNEETNEISSDEIDLDFYLDWNMNNNQNRFNDFDKFLKANNYERCLDNGKIAKKTMAYNSFSNIVDIDVYYKKDNDKISIELIYIDRGTIKDNNVSHHCIDTYDCSFVKNIYYIQNKQEYLKISHLHNIMNKYDIRLENLNDPVIKDKYEQILSEDHMKILLERFWMSNLSMFNPNKTYHRFTDKDIRTDDKDESKKIERLQKYVNRGFRFLIEN